MLNSYCRHCLLQSYCKALFTGRGGASIYGKCFEDEISPDLKHTGKKTIESARDVSTFYVCPCPLSEGGYIHINTSAILLIALLLDDY